MRISKRSIHILLAVFAFFVSFILQSQAVHPLSTPTLSAPLQTISSNTAFVTRIIDGDTIEIAGGEKVRYIGMNTPELARSGKKAECYAKEATEKNRSLVGEKTVTLVKDVSERDRYGRLLRFVYVDGTFVNLELIRGGYAERVSYPPDLTHQTEFSQAEATAKTTGLGMWDACK